MRGKGLWLGDQPKPDAENHLNGFTVRPRLKVLQGQELSWEALDTRLAGKPWAASPTTTPEPQRHSLLVQGYGLPTQGGRGGPRGAAALQGSTRQSRKELPSSSQSVQTQSRLFLGRTRSYFKQKGMNETQLKNFLGCIVVLKEVVYQAVDSSEAPAAKKMLDVLAQCREEIYPLIPKDTPASRPLHLTDLAQK